MTPNPADGTLPGHALPASQAPPTRGTEAAPGLAVGTVGSRTGPGP